jgi:hypothetical protein
MLGQNLIDDVGVSPAKFVYFTFFACFLMDFAITSRSKMMSMF